MDFLKRLFYFFIQNTKGRVDKAGKPFEDRLRRKQSKETQRKIESGEIVLPKKIGDRRCYKVMKDGKLSILKK